MPVRRHLDDAALDERIIRMHEEGRAPSDIGHDLSLKVEVVRERLHAHGIEPNGAVQHAVHPMWNLDDENERRLAIWKRQQEGARARRRELRREERHAAA